MYRVEDEVFLRIYPPINMVVRVNDSVFRVTASVRARAYEPKDDSSLGEVVLEVDMDCEGPLGSLCIEEDPSEKVEDVLSRDVCMYVDRFDCLCFTRELERRGKGFEIVFEISTCFRYAPSEVVDKVASYVATLARERLPEALIRLLNEWSVAPKGYRRLIAV